MSSKIILCKGGVDKGKENNFISGKQKREETLKVGIQIYQQRDNEA